MSVSLELKGLDNLAKDFRQKYEAHGRGAEDGIVKAGLWLLGESQRQVPVDTGNLRGSGDTRKEGSGWGTAIFVFYSAEYAVYVHEDMFANHTNGNAKFLENPLRYGNIAMSRIIKAEVLKEAAGVGTG